MTKMIKRRYETFQKWLGSFSSTSGLFLLLLDFRPVTMVTSTMASISRPAARTAKTAMNQSGKLVEEEQLSLSSMSLFLLVKKYGCFFVGTFKSIIDQVVVFLPTGSSMLFQRLMAPIPCPLLLKWKQSGAKKVASTSPSSV